MQYDAIYEVILKQKKVKMYLNAFEITPKDHEIVFTCENEIVLLKYNTGAFHLFWFV